MKARPHNRWAITGLAVTVLWVPPAQGRPLQPNPPCPPGSYAGVTFVLTEQAHDGTFTLCPGRKHPVDANADLVLTFRKPPVGAGDESLPPEHQILLRLLKEVGDLETVVVELDAATLDITDPLQVADFHRKVSEVDKRASDLLHNMERTGLKRDQILDIVSGKVPGGIPDPTKAYTNLGLWLKWRIESLQGDMDTFLSSKDRILVQVAAFRDSIHGGRAQLHVENYDELPLGDLSPIDRYGFRLTPEEQQEFSRQFDGNERIAAGVREVLSHGQSLKNEVRSLADRLRNEVDSLQDRLKAKLDDWSLSLGSATAALDNLRASSQSQAVKDAASGLINDLKAFQEDFKKVNSLRDQLSNLRARLEDSKTAGLATLLTGDGGLVPVVTGVKNGAADLSDSLKGWDDRLKHMADLTQALGGALSQDLALQITPGGMADFCRSLVKDLPGISSIYNALSLYFEVAAKPAATVNVLPDFSGSTPHGLEDLPPAIVDLERAGWRSGDRITVSVRFLDKSAPQASREAAEKVVHQETFQGQAVLTGLYSELSSAVTFSRGRGGSAQAQKWKPNVAALFDWHYYIRSPVRCGKFWNWLDMGTGIHLASLDQGDDSVEFGVGGHFTFWGGLVSAGYGYNLSLEKDREYVFVGVNLFDVLNRQVR